MLSSPSSTVRSSAVSIAPPSGHVLRSNCVSGREATRRSWQPFGIADRGFVAFYLERRPSPKNVRGAVAAPPVLQRHSCILLPVPITRCAREEGTGGAEASRGALSWSLVQVKPACPQCGKICLCCCSIRRPQGLPQRHDWLKFDQRRPFFVADRLYHK